MPVRNVREMIILLILLLSLPAVVFGLFDETNGSAADSLSYDLSGYFRSSIFGWEAPENNIIQLQSAFCEVSLKLKIKKMPFGDGFCELRANMTADNGEYSTEINLREGYINLYPGKFSFRFGHQIVVWGRADGFNPTDNITPRDMLRFSADEDDVRLGNLLLRSFYSAQPFRMEAVWIPLYCSSTLPTDIISFPPGVTFQDPEYPPGELKNSGYALKVNLLTSAADGSVSYFNGFNPSPGIDIIEETTTGIIVSPKAYRTHVIGVDLSTVIGRLFGFRGEFAYKNAYEPFETNIHIPNPELNYVFGVDKEYFGVFSIVFQYMGKYVLEYTEPVPPVLPQEMAAYQIHLKNRMISLQQHEYMNAAFLRIGLNLLYETLKLEYMGMYRLTTEEFFYLMRMSYAIADALVCTLGVKVYSGPEDSLYGTIGDHLSALYFDIKISF